MKYDNRMHEELMLAHQYVGRHFYIDFRKVRIIGCYGFTKVFYLCAWDDTFEVFVSDAIFVVSSFEDGKPIIDLGFKDD